jgi:hypothetical protein
MQNAKPPVNYARAQLLLDLGHSIRYVANDLGCSTQALYYGLKVGKIVRHVPAPAE